MECEICNTKQKSLYKCDNCNRQLCKACGKLSASEVKVLEIKGDRILKFECPKCLNFDTHMLLKSIVHDKEEIIVSKDEIINLLRQKIEDLESKQRQDPSYSDILRKPVMTDTNQLHVTKSVPHLIIKPKNQQKVERIRSDLQKNIKPAELKLCINGTRNTKNGNLLVKCSNMSDIETLKNEIDSKLHEDYEAQVSKMKAPRFKIIGYRADNEEDLNYELIEAHIREQNHFIQKNDDLEVTYIKQNRKNKTHTIHGKCSSSLFHKFMGMKKVFINWERYPIYEDISIQRCFKCQEYYHKSDACPNEERCEYCSGDHSLKDCPKKQKKCTNCIKTNAKFNLMYNVNHEASDSSCPAYEYLISILRSKIDYGGNNGC